MIKLSTYIGKTRVTVENFKPFQTIFKTKQGKKGLAFHSNVLLFVSRCRKLPRALKEWPAFEDLRRTIDDFNEMVPLLELMANKAMKTRHWQRMQDTTGHVFDVENENFTLRSILQAPLLRYKEEIEVRLMAFFHFQILIPLLIPIPIPFLR